MRSGMLKKKIDSYLWKEQLLKNEDHAKLKASFLSKARKNFTVANLLFRISDDDELKKSLGVAHGFEMYDWAIIASYYSMYASAMAALANLGFKSKSHAATIAVLEYYYVLNSGSLETEQIQKLSKAYAISEELIAKLTETKNKRETAQYDATPSISRENAKTALDDADDFITRIEGILS